MDISSRSQASQSTLLGHSCLQCQSITLPGEPEKIQTYRWESGGRPEIGSGGPYEKRVFHRLNISLQDIKNMVDGRCAFADHLFKSFGENVSKKELDWGSIHIFTETGKFLDGATITFWAVLHLTETCKSIERFAYLHNFYRSSKSAEEDFLRALGADEDFHRTLHADEDFHRALRADENFLRALGKVEYLIMAHEANDVEDASFLRPIAIDPLSKNTVTEIRSWLGECDTTWESAHRVCSISEQAFFPSRLIEISLSTNGYNLRLVEGSDVCKEQAHYSALSYCWGGDQEKKLTNGNLQSYKSAIPWGSLPATLKDAATTTYRLGLQYLWIDSMCIIKTDDDDKAKEIRRMAQVYTHAHFTIVDMRGSRAGDGFLHARTLPAGTSSLRYRSPADRRELTTLYFLPNIKSWDKKTLETRGWAMQEYVLSRRLIVFGTWSTQWMCRAKRFLGMDGWRLQYHDTLNNPFSERRLGSSWDTDWNHPADSDSDDLPNTAWYRTIKKVDVLDAILYYSMNSELERHQSQGFHAWKAWASLVEMYSGREFSDPLDRTIALSGLAEKFALFFPSSQKHIAGLWEEHFREELLWHPDRARLDRPSDYRAPTWSWQSIDTPVWYGFGYSDLVCTVPSVKHELKDSDSQFGAVTSAILEVTGPSFSLAWTYTRSEDETFENDRRQLKFLGSEDSEIEIAGLITRIDARENSTPWTEVVLLAIGYDEDDRSIRGLVLIQTEDARSEETFRRLGTFSTDCPSFESDENEIILPYIEEWSERAFNII